MELAIKEWEILEPEFKHITGAFVVIFKYLKKVVRRHMRKNIYNVRDI